MCCQEAGEKGKEYYLLDQKCLLKNTLMKSVYEPGSKILIGHKRNYHCGLYYKCVTTVIYYHNDVP